MFETILSEFGHFYLRQIIETAVLFSMPKIKKNKNKKPNCFHLTMFTECLLRIRLCFNTEDKEVTEIEQVSAPVELTCSEGDR